MHRSCPAAQLTKLLQAFRPGNVDLPTHQSHTANPTSLLLPDVITELDLLAPLPDPSLLLSQPPEELRGPDPTLLDFGSSQRSLRNLGRTRATSLEAPRLEDDLGLDLDLGDDVITPGFTGGARAIEVGRNAPAERGLAEDVDDTIKLYEGDDLALDIGQDDELPVHRESSIFPGLDAIQRDMDIPMPDLEDDFIPAPFDNVEIAPAPLARDRTRRSESPLSSVRSSVERDLEHSIFRQDPDIVNPEEGEEIAIVQHQRAKRRKVLQADTDTEMRSAQIKSQQEDRSKILKPLTLLPRDPTLLTLMNMQSNGEFVSNILGDGRSQGWAPQLRGILSLEVIRNSSDLKRKRNDRLAQPVEEPARAGEREGLGLQIEADDSTMLPSRDLDLPGNTTMQDEPMLQLHSDGIAEPFDNEFPDTEARTPDAGDLEAPLNVADEVGELGTPPAHDIVSLGTKHAVYLLRERFGSFATPTKRQSASVLFRDLLPERSTTRADATKMFFEVLVLATKDAITVSQATEELGSELTVTAKQDLWGTWAEAQAGGEIASQKAGAAVAVTA